MAPSPRRSTGSPRCWSLPPGWLPAATAPRLFTLHQTLGFSVFVVVAARLIWRLFDRRPTHELPAAVAWSSRIVHWLLYGLLLAIPLSAIVGFQLEGHPITLYGFGAHRTVPDGLAQPRSPDSRCSPAARRRHHLDRRLPCSGGDLPPFLHEGRRACGRCCPALARRSVRSTRRRRPPATARPSRSATTGAPPASACRR